MISKVLKWLLERFCRFAKPDAEVSKAAEIGHAHDFVSELPEGYEAVVEQSLDVFRHGKTAIVVAHRLATVKNADRILVFQNGAIVETGTHDELLAHSGIYADLAKFQLQ